MSFASRSKGLYRSFPKKMLKGHRRFRRCLQQRKGRRHDSNLLLSSKGTDILLRPFCFIVHYSLPLVQFPQLSGAIMDRRHFLSTTVAAAAATAFAALPAASQHGGTPGMNWEQVRALFPLD